MYNWCRLDFVEVVANETGENGDKNPEHHEINRDDAEGGDDDEEQEGQDAPDVSQEENQLGENRMGEDGDAALGLEISNRLIQDEDFEDYQPCGGPPDELSGEEANKKLSTNGDDDEGSEEGKYKCEVVNKERHRKVYVDGNSTSNKNAMTPTIKKRIRWWGRIRKPKEAKGSLKKPFRKSSRKRNAPIRY